MTIVPPPLGPGCREDVSMLKMLAASGRRPNCLFTCPAGEMRAVANVVAGLGLPPLTECILPGRLVLPQRPEGTLLLADIAALRIDQQIALFDWLSHVGRRVQVMAVSSVRLDSMVTDGRFLEGLYYRLNVVRVDVSKES